MWKNIYYNLKQQSHEAQVKLFAGISINLLEDNPIVSELLG